MDGNKISAHRIDNSRVLILLMFLSLILFYQMISMILFGNWLAVTFLSAMLFYFLNSTLRYKGLRDSGEFIQVLNWYGKILDEFTESSLLEIGSADKLFVNGLMAGFAYKCARYRKPDGTIGKVYYPPRKHYKVFK